MIMLFVKLLSKFNSIIPANKIALSTAEILSIFHSLFNNFSISLFKSMLNPKTNEFKYSSFNDLISNSFSKSPLNEII